MSKSFDESEKKFCTLTNGAPMDDPYSTQKIGKVGPMVLQDIQFMETMSHFDRERIPERVVHANGGGAFGYFECTDDVTDLTCASFLSEVGKKTKTLTRFSTVAEARQSPDTRRDPRGFSTKLYTDDGILDFVYNNTPVFFIRDPIKFVYFIHSQKRDPKTDLHDRNTFWDYLTNNPESLHQVMTLMSDRGTPASWRNMHCYSGHAYKWVKADGSFNYVQVHIKSDQGVKNLTNDEAVKLEGEDRDYNLKDLHDAIERGDYPSWTCYVQVMSPEEAEKQPFSIFDLTKVWPQGQFPLRRFGKLVLNKNPDNYFAQMEQAAFSPSNLVPGIEPSADPVLQSRLYSYDDTHRHRLGANYKQIPVNCPFHFFTPFVRDGPMNVTDNFGPSPNYPGPRSDAKFKQTSFMNAKHEKWIGHIEKYHWNDFSEIDFEQPRNLWKVLGKQPGQQENFIYNVATHALPCNPEIRERVVKYFNLITPELGKAIESKMKELKEKQN
ncbi:peroxisomal catalase A [Trichomonascus vanleenenianus]|uniref:catalase n=1 Tax=Trichomonascus vanleenenianus TaxID=2268995 RepID=UPI003ECBA749